MGSLYDYTRYIDEDIFKRLIASVESLDYNKKGGNSKCAIINEYAIIKTGNIYGKSDIFPRIIDEIYKLKKEGVNVVPILGYSVFQYGQTYKNGDRFDKGYIIQEKASGVELLYPQILKDKSNEECCSILMAYLTMLKNIPQEHFDKWVSDYKVITDNKIQIDPSKESNFFYDKEKGFSFIDLNFFDNQNQTLFNEIDEDGKQRHSNFILYTILPFRRFLYRYYDKYLKTKNQLDFEKDVINECFEKYLQAVKMLGISEENVIDVLNNRNVPLSKINKNLENNLQLN